MRTFLLILIFSFLSANAIARHIAGGEMSYKYLGPGAGSNTGRYEVLLRIYRDCDAPAQSQLDPNAVISIYAGGSSNPYITLRIPIERVETLSLTTPDPCISNPPKVCYQVGRYTFIIELPFNTGGYTLAYERCCRIDNLFNVVNSGSIGATYVANIPGQDQVATAVTNSSPVFNTSDTVIICANNSFKYDFGAKDPDGDLLEYRFDDAYPGGSTSDPAPNVASAPPYSGVSYSFGFSSAFPLGPDVSINPNTGLISGKAPVDGIYVIAVAVVEKRNGKVINIHRKELHLKVANCQLATADLDPSYITCDGFKLSFFNKTSNPLIRTYEWDFGIPSATGNISNAATPTFVYPAAGSYKVRLTINKNDKCSSVDSTIAKVYPGFNRGFKIEDACVGVPFTFIDTTKTAFGKVDKWKWDFGNTNATDDTAIISQATYTYTQPGTKNISLIVGTDLGCIDTVKKVLTVNAKPSLVIPNDTVICTIDTLQLNAVATGTFSWSPDYMISNTGVANPLVSPDTPTLYTVTVTQAPGCENTQSVFVDVKSFVSLKAGYDTTICLGDSILLSPVSDAVSYTWSPAAAVVSPNSKQTWAKPTTNTRFSVFTRIGKCQATDGFVVNTIPYPTAIAGKDTTICFGDSARLSASGGLQYLWNPGNTLDDQTLQFPFARPYQTTKYVVGVYDNKGCPKPSYDTVMVTVIPPVAAFAGRDTVSVIGQPLQLLATGGTSFEWSPASYLDNPKIPNPIAKLNDSISYSVRVSTVEGCFAYDTIKVKVYKTPPEIFVPTAFTPNDDNLNDILMPIPVGIAKLIYFKVYNRFGEMVFSTDVVGKGWNGIFRGRDQGNESFTWQAMAIDYLGNPVFRKGQVTIIR